MPLKLTYIEFNFEETKKITKLAKYLYRIGFMKKIAVLTSGGDAPGMNACIRAVVRSAIHYGLEVVGIVRGYDGMISGAFTPMNRRSVSNIIQKGGTILKSARSDEFRTKEGRAKAYKQLRENGIDYGVLKDFKNPYDTNLPAVRSRADYTAGQVSISVVDTKLQIRTCIKTGCGTNDISENIIDLANR